MKNKKGQVGMYVGVIISFVLAIVILTAIAFPQWRTTTTAQTTTDTLTAHVKGAANTTTTLTETDLVSGGLSIAGLTLGLNYTVDYDTAVVTINDTTNNGTYTASYSFYDDGYIQNTGTRAFAGVVILLIIVGLAGGLFKMFGLL